jgi:hypothetical protein
VLRAPWGVQKNARFKQNGLSHRQASTKARGPLLAMGSHGETIGNLGKLLGCARDIPSLASDLALGEAGHAKGCKCRKADAREHLEEAGTRRHRKKREKIRKKDCGPERPSRGFSGGKPRAVWPRGRQKGEGHERQAA